MKRLPHWEESLNLYLDRVQYDRFEWGKHDCALFAAHGVKSMTGIDPAEAFRNRYSDERGAALALREHGAGTLLKTVKSWFGAPKHVAQAHRGDVVMLDRTTCGICVGHWSVFVGREEYGNKMIHLPTSSCRYAFTLPY